MRNGKPNRIWLAAFGTSLALWPAAAAQQTARPNFSPDASTGWIAYAASFMPPPSGPGPVADDPLHPYGSDNAGGRQATYRVADLSNPILLPWVREELRKVNEASLSGKMNFTPKERCWPIGVPGFLQYAVFPVYFVQAPHEVVMIWAEDHQVRRIYLDRPHSPQVKPSWFGESVGRYEGDTLVIDTIGMNDRTYVDSYRTPHTDKLHVVERFRMIDGGKTLEVNFTVDDPGAFTTPWRAVQRYRRIDAATVSNDPRIPKNGLEEMACAENNAQFLNYAVPPIPTAEKPDF